MKAIITIILLLIGCYIVFFSNLPVDSKIVVIVLGVISGVIANYLSKMLFKDNNTKQIEKLIKQLEQIKDPSEILKKSDKLEEKIESNKKITSEEKESLTQSIREAKEKKSKEFFDSGLKNYKKVPSNLNAAMENFNNSIIINPDFAEAYFYRGLVYAIKNLNEDALNDFNKAIELNPEYIEAYRKRGDLNESMGNHEGAKKDSAKALVYEGKSKYESGNYGEAIKDFDEAIKLFPDYVEAYFNRGNAKG